MTAANSQAVFDRGLQPERTALAWRRTSMSLLVCSVAGARVLGPSLGWWALIVGVAGVGATALITFWAQRRHQHSLEHLLGHRDPTGGHCRDALPDGRHLVLTAALVLMGAVLGIGYVVVRAVL